LITTCDALGGAPFAEDLYPAEREPVVVLDAGGILEG